MAIGELSHAAAAVESEVSDPVMPQTLKTNDSEAKIQDRTPGHIRPVHGTSKNITFCGGFPDFVEIEEV